MTKAVEVSMRGTIRRLLAAAAIGAGGLAIVPVADATAAPSAHSCPTPVRATINGKVLRSSAPVAPIARCTPSRAHVAGDGSAAPRMLGMAQSAYNGGKPPLTFNGGAVMGTSVPGEVTITPIFWTPPGFTAPSPTYTNLVNQFDSDLAADSSLRTNVLSTITDYTDASGTHLHNVIHAASPIAATDAVATSGVIAGETVVGCSADPGVVTGAEGDQFNYAGCVTDVQIMAEVEAVRAQHGLANDAAHLYPVFLPKGLESCFGASNGTQGGDCVLNASSTKSQYCAYHSSVEVGGGAIYTVEPFPARSTSAGRCDLGVVTTGVPQAPNGDLAFDSTASPYSHEVAEAITDPFGDGWFDAVGNENGDECAYMVPDTLGGTSGAAWDQTINGHHYLVQSEFSNLAYAWNSQKGCLMATTPPPVVSGISAQHLAVGEPLTISGEHLDGSPIVSIGGQVATVASGTSSAVTVVVPDRSTGGAVSVQTVSGTATASVPLAIVPRAAPAFTSTTAVTAVVHMPVSTTVSVTGYPIPAITESGALPSGLQLVDAGNGTASLSGTPAVGTGGSWPITLTAINSEGTSTQSLMITVHAGAAIMSSTTAGFIAGSTGSFTVTSAGLPTATVSLSGALPKGLVFSAHQDGTASLAGLVARSRIGTYLVTLTAANGVGTPDVETMTIVVGATPRLSTPTKVTIQRGATVSISLATTGSPTPVLSVVGLEPWMRLTTTPGGTGTITGRSPSGGVARTIALSVVGSNLLGTTTKSLQVKLR